MADEFLELGNVVNNQNPLPKESADEAVPEQVQTRVPFPVFDENSEHGIAVEPIREHGVIVGMQIACTCGEKKTIWFQYETPAG